MNIPEAQTIKIGEAEFPNVKWRSRIVFEYETMTGESYFKATDKTENQFKLFYCAAKIGSRLVGKEFKYTFEQFLDLTDDYFVETFQQFNQALFPPGGGDKKKSKVLK